MERQGTSGMIFEVRGDGTLRVGYEDYGVDFFGGRDFECYYTFEIDMVDALCKALETDRKGLKKALGDFVGDAFDTPKFEKLCKDNNLTYSRATYS